MEIRKKKKHIWNIRDALRIPYHVLGLKSMNYFNNPIYTGLLMEALRIKV